MQNLGVYGIKEAVQAIIPYLEDTGRSAPKTIYFDGWDGLAASAVLTAIAEDPPPSLTKKFDRIIHIDCSRWKSRRALQKIIADKLKLPQSVMVTFDREDDEDDFSGVDEDSRAEIEDIGRTILGSLSQYRFLVIFHNGSTDMVDLADFGIPQPLFGITKIMWTFTGILHLHPETKEKVDNSHLCIYRNINWSFDGDTAQLILEEATEVIKHMQHKQSITPQITAKCITYILWLHEMGGSTMDYNWATHASNYWVCDGIMGQQGQLDDESWEVSAALHKQVQRMELSSCPIKFEGYEHRDVWKSVTCTSDSGETQNLTAVSQNLTSLFLVSKGRTLTTLPHEMFQKLERLRVLKLSGCNFSFHSPPFRCCRSLRFLGLDHCGDQGREEDKQGRPIMEFFHSLWVLDMSHTDWDIDMSQDLTEQMASNIREIHIKKGRIGHSHLAWRQLRNLRKLRVIEPTSSWETLKKDEFTDMVMLELLDLSGNSTIQVLPSLSSATRLRTLILDGCVGLDHIGPEGIPASLESFSLDARAGKDGNNTAKISRVSLAGCGKLVNFTLLGTLPNLEELDLSCTAVKTLNLKKDVQVEKLGRIFLMGCQQLRALIWPENGMQQLRLLCIDTRQGVVVSRETSHYSIVCQEQDGYCQAHVSIMDIRLLQSLVLTGSREFCWSTTPFKLNLYLSCTIKDDGENCNSEKVGHRLHRTAQIAGSRSVVNKSLISNTCSTYNDVSIEQIVITEDDDSSALQFEPQDLHFEMGHEMIDINMADNSRGIKALYFVMDRVQSLHLHDNYSISSIIPEHITSTREEGFKYRALKWFDVEKCPKLDTVFHTNYDGPSFLFDELEAFRAADLLMARSIWSRGRAFNHAVDETSFGKLQTIHLYRCTRLKFVLPLSWNHTLSSLETLHIVCCGDLRQVFPVETGFLATIAAVHQNGMLEFPRLKDLYLHHLSSLRQICEAKMFAPKLKTVRIRGCWGLKRLPAVNQDGLPAIVDCEKDWWNDLEWDGLDVGHHPSLFRPCHSGYYKKQMLRSTVLR
ncbi:hypothetical protein SORBI_3006G017400 [Sorghum bicolor]|uniref:Disease resistance protein At4g27190-like leucine-rich repeats domain-containing protein n=2 Tax=Sorghum bicolor TaxID=4558 RepID=A0A1B6PJH6_SORBI|nr:hypothetical protein SORBI_3006G017400 [Sorghum bicolor]